jgi:hypothetical protein
MRELVKKSHSFNIVAACCVRRGRNGAGHWPNLTKNGGFATGFLRFGNAAAGALPPFFAPLTHQSALKKMARSVG